jgi:hypothetical protein
VDFGFRVRFADLYGGAAAEEFARELRVAFGFGVDGFQIGDGRRCIAAMAIARRGVGGCGCGFAMP